MNKVYIEPCKEYDYLEIRKILFGIFEEMDLLKGMDFQGKKILVKPNLLKGNKPEEGVTTHPTVVEAVCVFFKDKGADVIIGDSPGGPFTQGALRSIYRLSGLAEVAERTGCRLNFDTDSVVVENPEAKKLKKMEVMRVAAEADYIVNVAKLKTHCMMTYTGAAKNLFGLIPGLIKADYHLKMKTTENFAEHLVDICEYAKPILNIVDGIIGMEGNGPSSGELRNSGVLVVSDNPYSADLACCQLIHIDSDTVPLLEIAKKRKLRGSHKEDISYMRKSPAEIEIAPFKLPETASVTFVGGRVPKFAEELILNRLRPRPVVKKKECVGCGVCRDVCPAKVIEMKSGLPEIHLEGCIRCFCCHELCPKKAMDVESNRIYDFVMGVKKRR